MAALARQVGRIEQRLDSPAEWPEWYAHARADLETVAQAAASAGVRPEDAFRPSQGRGQIIRALRASGWSISRTARVLRVSERAVRYASRMEAGAEVSSFKSSVSSETTPNIPDQRRAGPEAGALAPMADG